jgi:hypothetical protein
MSREAEEEMTFDNLVRLEPRLAVLANEARGYREEAKYRRNFCANAVWYGPGNLRSRLIRLVGWFSTHPDPAVCSSRAYKVAYETIYGLLPDCRHRECPRYPWLGEPDVEYAGPDA